MKTQFIPIVLYLIIKCVQYQNIRTHHHYTQLRRTKVIPTKITWEPASGKCGICTSDNKWQIIGFNHSGLNPFIEGQLSLFQVSYGSCPDFSIISVLRFFGLSDIACSKLNQNLWRHTQFRKSSRKNSGWKRSLTSPCHLPLLIKSYCTCTAHLLLVPRYNLSWLVSWSAIISIIMGYVANTSANTNINVFCAH